MTDSSLEIKECSDRLYYDQYRYSLKLRMKNFSCLRDLCKPRDSLTDMSRVVADRYTNRVFYSRRFINYAFLEEHSSNQPELDDLLDMLAFLWPVKEKVKIIFSGDWGYLYSNNKVLLQKVIDKDYVQVYYIKEVVVDRPKNTIVLKSSPYRFRSFLQEKLWTRNDKNRMLTYLENQHDIKIGR